MAKSAKNFVRGALFGTLLGAVTALLYAPKKGEKLRKELLRKCSDVSDKANNMIEEVRERSTDLAERAKEFAYAAKDVFLDRYRR